MLTQGGGSFVFALTKTGEILGWGHLPAQDYSKTPVPIGGFGEGTAAGPCTDLATGRGVAACITADGKVWMCECDTGPPCVAM